MNKVSPIAKKPKRALQHLLCYLETEGVNLLIMNALENLFTLSLNFPPSTLDLLSHLEKRVRFEHIFHILYPQRDENA